MSVDELLRTEFASRELALAANSGMDFLSMLEIVTPPVRVGELCDADQFVQYTIRRAVLKRFDFPRGCRWKFCLVSD